MGMWCWWTLVLRRLSRPVKRHHDRHGRDIRRPSNIVVKPPNLRISIRFGAALHMRITRRDPRLSRRFLLQSVPSAASIPNVSVEFETVVNTALQYNPADRFPALLP
jgi:hypothetical protein